MPRGIKGQMVPGPKGKQMTPGQVQAMDAESWAQEQMKAGIGVPGDLYDYIQMRKKGGVTSVPKTRRSVIGDEIGSGRAKNDAAGIEREIRQGRSAPLYGRYPNSGVKGV